LFVIPFIFYMSLTGLPFVWQSEIEDMLHPDYRALNPGNERVSYEKQLQTAQATLPGQRLLKVKVDGNPRHATQFTFGKASDPRTVAINPYTGEVISVIREWTRISFAAIRLHGLAFVAPYGSWLIELLACWGIVLCLTGMYLWWPRGAAGETGGVYVARIRKTGRSRWRDLHAVTGFYFGTVLALYFATGLPWTAFWGGQLLTSFQKSIGQLTPAKLTDDSGLSHRPTSPGARPLPLDAFVAFGLGQNLPGYLELVLPFDTNGTVHLHNRVGNSTLEKQWQLDLYTAMPAVVTGWSDVPVVQQIVSLGIDAHEGHLAGRPTQILSTLLSVAFMFLAGAAACMWWKRRPQGKLDFPKAIPHVRLSMGPRIVLVVLGLGMPLLGLSFLVFRFVGSEVQELHNGKPLEPV
jgi:uncharacterized iron-regulated membrane protein